MPDKDDLHQLLDKLRRAGQEPERALLDRVKAYGPAAVGPLIEMAVDEDLHNADSDSPEVWAPLHAIQLLGEIGAPEAVEPLLGLFDMVDDDWIAELLPEAFGGIGAPAVGPLRDFLFDRTKDLYARAGAAESLDEIGERHPETRADVVNALVARLDPQETRTTDDKEINGFVICELLDLKAVEALPAITSAFAEGRVDTEIVDLSDVSRRLGLSQSAIRSTFGEHTLSRGSGVAQASQPIRAGRKIGRNEPCPCGSGKKYKKCHGR